MRAHDVGDAADFGGGSEFVNRGFLPPPAFLEGFDGDIEANLAAKLEAVGHRLCRGKHSKSCAGNRIFFQSKVKGWPGHAQDANGGRGNFGCPGFVTDRHPDLVGRLRCEIMKPERGVQATDSLGDLVSRFDEGGVLSSGEIPGGIETAAALFEGPPASQPREIRSGNAEFRGIFGPYDVALRRALA